MPEGLENAASGVGAPQETEDEQDAARDGRQRPAVSVPEIGVLRDGGFAGPRLSAHAGSPDGRNDMLQLQVVRGQDGHLGVQDVERQLVVAADDRSARALEDRDLFGAVHPHDLELQPRLVAHALYSD